MEEQIQKFLFNPTVSTIATIFITASVIGVKEDAVTKYEQHIHDGKYLLLVSGNEEGIEQAERILHTEGTHLE